MVLFVDEVLPWVGLVKAVVAWLIEAVSFAGMTQHFYSRLHLLFNCQWRDRKIFLQKTKIF
jgi:hypothetical protein